MSDPYTDQARVLAALSAENGLLRFEIERLTERLERNAATLRNREDVNCRLLTENARLRAVILEHLDEGFLPGAKSVRNEKEENFPGDNQ